MNTPHALADKLVSLSAEYTRLSDELATLLTNKPFEWLTLRQNVKSDTAAQRAYESTEKGTREIVVKLKLKALEKEMSSIRTYLKVLSDESHNQY